jgi:hypothetical protein
MLNRSVLLTLFHRMGARPHENPRRRNSPTCVLMFSAIQGSSWPSRKLRLGEPPAQYFEGGGNYSVKRNASAFRS